jgi:hypothetical protein
MQPGVQPRGSVTNVHSQPAQITLLPAYRNFTPANFALDNAKKAGPA